MMHYECNEMLDLDRFEQQIVDCLGLPSLVQLHRLCSESWTSQYHREQTGYSGPLDGWKLTTSDYWVQQIADRMDAAAEYGDELAQQLLIIESAAFALDELGKSDDAEHLFQVVEEMYGPYAANGVEALLPRHSCFFYGPFQLLLARTVFPQDDWELYESDEHAFVGNSNGVVFDLLLYRDGLGPHHEGATLLDLGKEMA